MMFLKSFFLCGVFLAAAFGSAAGRRRLGKLPFDSIRFFFELNDTDKDLGVQLNLGPTEPWKKLSITYPDGRTMVKSRVRKSMRRQGMSDFFFESGEPNFEEVSKNTILRRFPEGTYKFAAITIDGEEMEGTAFLSHKFPIPPEITFPAGTEDDRPEIDVFKEGGLTVEWKSAPATDIEIDSYQVIVTNQEAPELFVYDVRVPPTATSLSVPTSFFARGTDYEVEVLARATSPNGNQVISIVFFATPK